MHNTVLTLINHNHTMNNLEIFDKEGNPLNTADVIYNFIKTSAEKHKKDIQDTFIGVDIGFPTGKTPIWIYTTESVNNGYDAIDLNNFGDPIKVNYT